MTYFSLIDLFNKRMAERKKVGLTSVPEKDKHGRLLADICLMDGTFAKEGDVRAEIALHLHSIMGQLWGHNTIPQQ
jgi:hypothetical protein